MERTVSTNLPKATATKVTDQLIKLTTGSQVAGVTLSLDGNKLKAELKSAFVCVAYKSKIVVRESNSKFEKEVLPGSVLVFGHAADEKLVCSALAERAHSSIYDFVSGYFKSKFLPDFSGELFVVSIKKNKPGKALKLSDPIRGGPKNEKFSSLKFGEYSEKHFTIGSDDEKDNRFGLFSLVDDTLCIAAKQIVLCTIRGEYRPRCHYFSHQYLTYEGFWLVPGDILIFKIPDSINGVTSALRKNPLSSKHFKNSDYFHVIPGDSPKTNFLAMLVEEEAN